MTTCIQGFEDISELNPKLFHPLLQRFAAKIEGKKWRRGSSVKRRTDQSVEQTEQSTEPDGPLLEKDTKL